MHRIDTPSATANNMFTEGSPAGGVPATVVDDTFMNDVQENICRVIEAAGIVLVKGDYDQLRQAIAATVVPSMLAYLGEGGSGANDHVKIPFRDKTTGAKRFFTFNWGTTIMNGATLAVTFSSAYSVACRFATVIDAGTANRSVANSSMTLTGATFTFSASFNTTVFWFALGV